MKIEFQTKKGELINLSFKTNKSGIPTYVVGKSFDLISEDNFELVCNAETSPVAGEVYKLKKHYYVIKTYPDGERFGRLIGLEFSESGEIITELNPIIMGLIFKYEEKTNYADFENIK